MKYNIIKAEFLATLISKVNNAIGHGWIPHGSMFIIEKEICNNYYQPMIKVD